MPPAAAVIGGVAAGVLAGVGSAVAGSAFIAGSVLATALVVGAVTAALSIGMAMLQQAMAPKPEMPHSPDRTINVRQPITPWRIVYGYTRSSGPITFVQGTNLNNRLHMIVTLACHEIDEIVAVQLNDYIVYSDNIDASTHMVKFGPYKNRVRIKYHLGSPDQEADPDLLAETEAVSTDRGRGRAYVYIRFGYNQDVFVSGLPSVSVWMYGKKLFDPRTGNTVFSPNPTLMLRDYITRPLYLGGMGLETSRVNDTVLQASANSCEEFVTVTSTDHIVFNVDDTLNCIEFDTDTLVNLTLGDRVRMSVIADPGDGTPEHPPESAVMPTPLAVLTDYYIVPFREHLVDSVDPYLYVAKPAVRLATSYANALTRTVIDITNPGSGIMTLTRIAEPRYVAAGTVELDDPPGQILDNIRASMAGRIYLIGGQWVIKCGVYTMPTWTLIERDLRRGPQITTKVSRRDRFNAVRGAFLAPENFWQDDEYPIVINGAYEADDGNIRIFTTLDMPFAFKPFTCQRIAKIELERGRREMAVTLPCKLSAFQVQAGDSIYVTLDRYGWNSKEFEVMQWQLVGDEDDAGAPYIGVDLQVREIDSNVFAWNADEEGYFAPAKRTELISAFLVGVPGAPVITESTYQTRDGAGIKAKVTMTWEASTDGYVTFYRPEYKRADVLDWTQLPQVTASFLAVDIFDVNPAVYDFRVIAINVMGSNSATSEVTTREIFGLLAPPTPPAGLTMVGMGGMALLRWDKSPDLDVLNGGYFEVRHSQAEINALWEESVTIGNVVPGYETVGVFPLKPGTYLVKAVDSMGIKSTSPSAVSTAGATVLGYTTLNTIIEEPTFFGTHSGTVGVDSILKLGSTGLWDDIPDVDAVTLIDSFGGGVALSGTYTFSTLMDLTTIQRVRIRTTLAVVITDTFDLFDERTANIDDWDNFDGTTVGDADAQVWVRVTDDDPNASPTWSEYQRAESAEFECRGLQYQCRLSTTDPAYNIEVSTLQVKAEQVT